MEYAADDINIGFMTCLIFINSEHTLVDKLSNITEINPINNQGGVSFEMVLKTMPTYVEITMNYNNNFDIYTRTEKGEVEFKDESAATVVDYLNIFYINMVSDENRLLMSALDTTTYRKIAKKMHYRENYGDNLSGY